MQNRFINRKVVSTRDNRTFVRKIALLVLFTLSGTQLTAADSPDIVDDIERLKRGEILVQTIHKEQSGGAARVTALFYSDEESIWNTIGYCENEFIYVRGLELCEVLVPGLQYIKKHHRVNNNWYTPTIDFVFEASRNSPTLGEFGLVEGNLKVMEGQWLFQPLPDQSAIVVTHDIRIRSKFPAPRWLVRRVLKKDLPDMLACVRGLAQASGDGQRVADDLERCPGDTTQVGK